LLEQQKKLEKIKKTTTQQQVAYNGSESDYIDTITKAAFENYPYAVQHRQGR